MRNLLTLCTITAVLAGCTSFFEPESSEPYGLAQADKSTPGPQVVFDPLRLPQPEIPFPNDLALRRRSDGGTFVNVSNQSETRVDRLNREHLDDIDGFSGLSPIQVAFDGPVDLTTVTDNSVFVVNIQPGSARFGERLPLDLGRGWFPQTAVPHAYFPRDPYAKFDSFIMPPTTRSTATATARPTSGCTTTKWRPTRWISAR